MSLCCLHRQVDNNPCYDSLVLETKDAEADYFNFDTADDGISGSDDLLSASTKMEEAEGVGEDGRREECDDYMLYEPSADLVAQSIEYTRIWAHCTACNIVVPAACWLREMVGVTWFYRRQKYVNIYVSCCHSALLSSVCVCFHLFYCWTWQAP